MPAASALLLLVVVCGGALAGVPHRKREARGPCPEGGVCGWAVYKKTDINLPVDYFVRNECYCPEGKKCLYKNIDVSINSYTYQCMTDMNGGGLSPFPDNV